MTDNRNHDNRTGRRPQRSAVPGKKRVEGTDSSRPYRKTSAAAGGAGEERQRRPRQSTASRKLQARRQQVRKERLTLGVSALLVLVLIIASAAVTGKRSGKSAKEAVAASASSESLASVSVSEGPYVEPTYTKEEIETADGIPAISTDYSKVIRVNLAQCVATVYDTSNSGSATTGEGEAAATDGSGTSTTGQGGTSATDESGVTGTPIKAFVCSPAREGYTTPEGEFYLGEWYEWCYLADGTFGQYAFRIIDNVNNDIMFHSVPYMSQDKGTLEEGEYNKLGTAASMGCMRMAVRDVRWLCENCGFGTKVIIYSDADEELPLGKPEADFIPPEDTEISGWDPTDPDPANPWRDYDLTLSVPNVIRVDAGKAVSVDEWKKTLADETLAASSSSDSEAASASSADSSAVSGSSAASDSSPASGTSPASASSAASGSSAASVSSENEAELTFHTSALAPYAQAKDSLGHDLTKYLTDNGGYDLNKPGVYQTTVTLKAGPVTAVKDVTVAVSG